MLDKFFRTIEKIVPAKYQWVLNHEGFKRYFANTGWMFFGQMFSLLVSFFIGAWIARYLGPGGFGVMSYSIAFSGLFGFIASLGVDGILNRELVRHPENRDELLGTSFRLKLIGGVIAFAFCVFSAFILNTTQLIKLLITLFSFTFILQSANVISIYFQAGVKSKNNVKALFISNLISASFRAAVIFFDYGLIWIIFAYSLDLFLQGVFLFRAYRKLGFNINNWVYNNNLAKKMLKNSWPLMLSSAAGYIYLKIDQVIIGIFLGDRQVGIYAAAVKLVEVWYFVPLIISTSLFPAIINAKKAGLEVYKNRLKSFYILMAIMPIIIAIPVSIFSSSIITIIFGDSYLESINILRIYIWSSFGLFLCMATSQYLMSENFVRTIFLFNLLAMIMNVSLNFILIPQLGLHGPAWATLISYLIFPLLVFSGKNIINKIR